ncbi:MAG: hypothetical protein LBC82_01655 [Oscillospiraceae bacterium]|jgi:hypothetical protein|nr:hypothetical protein [Oscillospiraceae bacterium]
MKKTITLTLSTILLFTLCACTADVEPENPVAQRTDAEIPTAQISAESEETQTIQDVDIGPMTYQSPFEFAEVPQPFVHFGGDENTNFFVPFTERMYLGATVEEEFAKYLGFNYDEFIEDIHRKLGDGSNAFYLTGLMEAPYLFALIIEYDIPDYIIMSALQRHNEIYEGFAIEFDTPGFRDNIFTEKEIEAFLSRDSVKVLEQFASLFAIVVGDRIYSPVWLYIHTPEEWQLVGITPEMVEERLELFSEFNFTPEAARAFESKLSDFTGRDVVFNAVSWIYSGASFLLSPE